MVFGEVEVPTQPSVAADLLPVQGKKVVVNSDCLGAWNFHRQLRIKDKRLYSCGCSFLSLNLSLHCFGYTLLFIEFGHL
jgi:hypothetical protein